MKNTSFQTDLDPSTQENELSTENSHEELCINAGENLDLHELNIEVMEEDRNSLIVVHCDSNVRSRHITKLLKNHGYHKVYALQSGLIGLADEDSSHWMTY